MSGIKYQCILCNAVRTREEFLSHLDSGHNITSGILQKDNPFVESMFKLFKAGKEKAS